MPLEIASRKDWDLLLADVDTVLFDCDGTYRICLSYLPFIVHNLYFVGVLWLGEECIPGAQELVRALKQKVVTSFIH